MGMLLLLVAWVHGGEFEQLAERFGKLGFESLERTSVMSGSCHGQGRAGPRYAGVMLEARGGKLRFHGKFHFVKGENPFAKLNLKTMRKRLRQGFPHKGRLLAEAPSAGQPAQWNFGLAGSPVSYAMVDAEKEGEFLLKGAWGKDVFYCHLIAQKDDDPWAANKLPFQSSGSSNRKK